jgi:hypothetical protein
MRVNSLTDVIATMKDVQRRMAMLRKDKTR